MNSPTVENALVAQEFRNDPRVAEAKRLIREALLEQQERLTGVQPPNPLLKKSYDELLADFAECRGGKLWFPYVGSGFGNKALVELEDGSVKYDFITGIGVHYFGHNNPDLLDASIDGALSNSVMQGHLQQNRDSFELIQLLTKSSGLDHCFLTTTGVMACENGFKLLLQKKSPANRILAFERCFMGRTLALSQVTDKAAYRQGLPSNIGVDYIPFYDATDPDGSTERAVSTLKKFLARYPKQYALMAFELVQGEGGFYPGTTSFFKALMDVLREHTIPILVDEVQTFGRTPQLFAFQYFGLEEYVDVVTMGKLSQVCATLYRKEFVPGPGLLSQTFTGSSVAIKVSKQLIEMLLDGGFFGKDGKIVQTHEYLTSRLEEVAKRYPDLLSGPYGIGTMVAFTVLGGDPARVLPFTKELFEEGVIAFVAGTNPMRVRFLVPVGAVTHRDIDAVVEIVEKTLTRK